MVPKALDELRCNLPRAAEPNQAGRFPTQMVYFDWRREMSVCYTLIDDQHRTLLALAEAVAESLFLAKGQQLPVKPLQSLIAFEREHFAFEEAIMRRSGYPETDDHLKLHYSPPVELETYCAKARARTYAMPAGSIAYHWNWLIVCINPTDRQLASWLTPKSQPYPKVPVVRVGGFHALPCLCARLAKPPMMGLRSATDPITEPATGANCLGSNNMRTLRRHLTTRARPTRRSRRQNAIVSSAQSQKTSRC